MLTASKSKEAFMMLLRYRKFLWLWFYGNNKTNISWVAVGGVFEKCEEKTSLFYVSQELAHWCHYILMGMMSSVNSDYFFDTVLAYVSDDVDGWFQGPKERVRVVIASYAISGCLINCMKSRKPSRVWPRSQF
jgi:hypothetical protein